MRFISQGVILRCRELAMMMCTSSTPWPGEHVQHNLQNRLPKVRCGHRRQRQTDIVDGDRHFHARFELSEQRIAARADDSARTELPPRDSAGPSSGGFG